VGTGGWVLAGFSLALFWVRIIVGTIALVCWLVMSGKDGGAELRKTPLELQKERYARGEIGREGYEQKHVCVSNIDEDGFPTGGIVDLKTASERGFVFCTHVDSAKGRHIQRDPRTAMTVWWDHVGYQVGIMSHAEAIAAAEADHFWNERSRSGRLTTTVFELSKPMATEDELAARLQKASEELADRHIPRPDHWGGYCVRPVSIEFMTFLGSY